MPWRFRPTSFDITVTLAWSKQFWTPYPEMAILAFCRILVHSGKIWPTRREISYSANEAN